MATVGVKGLNKKQYMAAWYEVLNTLQAEVRILIRLLSFGRRV